MKKPCFLLYEAGKRSYSLWNGFTLMAVKSVKKKACTKDGWGDFYRPISLSASIMDRAYHVLIQRLQ